jgi:hypothetical protein
MRLGPLRRRRLPTSSLALLSRWASTYGNMPVFDRPGAPAAAERERAEQILGCALRGRRVVHHRSRFSAGGGAHRFHRRGPRGAGPGSRDVYRGVRFVSVLVVPASAAGARFRGIADGEPSCVGWRSSKAVGGARSRRRRRCERSNLGVRPTHPCIWVPLFGNRRSSFLELRWSACFFKPENGYCLGLTRTRVKEPVLETRINDSAGAGHRPGGPRCFQQPHSAAEQHSPACGDDNAGTILHTTGETSAANREAPIPTTTPIRITAGGSIVRGTLQNNAATAFLLAQLPLELSFSDFGGQEKIASLPAVMDHEHRGTVTGARRGRP